jgi:hypothetical protein
LGVVVSAAVYLASSALEPSYRASAELTFNLPVLEQDLVRLLDLEPVPLARANVLPDTVIAAEPSARSRIARQVASRLRGVTPADVLMSVKVGHIKPNAGSLPGAAAFGTLLVTATADRPEKAAALANLFASGYVDFRARALRAQTRTSLTRLGDSQELEVLRSLAEDTVTLSRHADIPALAISPRPTRNTLVAAVLGLWLGLMMAVLLQRTTGSEQRATRSSQ